MSVIALNTQNYDSIINGGKTVLIDFYADWCGPCRMVSPIIDEIAEQRTDIIVCKVNVDQQIELAQNFGVQSIPMIVVMKNGKITNQVIGARPKTQILAMLD